MRVITGLVAILAAAPLAYCQENEDEPPPSNYCGVHALARALRSYDEKVFFEDFLKPNYISSRRLGSSAEDLVAAARSYGYAAHVMTNLNCFALEYMDCPVILHMKFDSESDTYNHWVLFTGISDGQAVIYEGPKPASLMSLPDLASRWDGVGILIEKGNDNLLWVYMVFLTLLLIGIAFVVIALAVFMRVYDQLLGRTMSQRLIWGSIAEVFFVVAIATRANALYFVHITSPV